MNLSQSSLTDSQSIVAGNKIFSGYSKIEEQQQDSRYQIENLLADELKHIKHVLEEEYSRLVENKEKFVRQKNLKDFERCLDEAIIKYGCSQPIITIAPLPGSKISWVSTHPLTRNHRRYSQFFEDRLLSKLENYLILRKGQKLGSELISKIQRNFQKCCCEDLEYELTYAKQGLSSIFLLIQGRIVENQNEKIQIINQRQEAN